MHDMAVDALACAHNRARGVDWPRERRACRLAAGGRLCAAGGAKCLLLVRSRARAPRRACPMHADAGYTAAPARAPRRTALAPACAREGPAAGRPPSRAPPRPPPSRPPPSLPETSSGRAGAPVSPVSRVHNVTPPAHARARQDRYSYIRLRWRCSSRSACARGQPPAALRRAPPSRPCQKRVRAGASVSLAPVARAAASLDWGPCPAAAGLDWRPCPAAAGLDWRPCPAAAGLDWGPCPAAAGLDWGPWPGTAPASSGALRPCPLPA